ncbi:outer membrane lipoprotein carrier protein LolA [Xenorhabdus griffiniae]|uniref:Outer membrane lipoprotein carrier protein LolA n=1 Tax=Xenorhabdus griffiniae TaxID=351672 RepID=A0ABY9XN50_9GAMM|nr:outer membrane lipoprotein carrier protein LolA [Xenorhabdus griffiniae]MBD1226762.1 outer membrane lipoprotein carrier protein LolA [Xenorhabdus griffiniae]MBE8587637.1 outer membrane lipoprotein carrier protein LolA [Xenorhabdus griffiniae]WMV74376.1 outer membrane lipoprotein carrier protein LolA [Xenorhabdus griffiniae]WNH04056.1 outer membrane lipoprotein carrier protein LolA [Xenorhabdus griffiniae]
MLSLTTIFIIINNTSYAVTLEELQQRFAHQPIVRANFTQIRQIQGIPHPLSSSGQMLISQHKGLWWHQQKPFPLTLLLDDNHMVQIMSGQTPQVITADSNPQLFQFNHLMRALFQADRAVLEENFNIEFSDLGQEKWRLILTPKTSPLDKLFTAITLNGQTHLDAILLTDRQGDRTELSFSHHQLTPETLSHEEEQYFKF